MNAYYDTNIARKQNVSEKPNSTSSINSKYILCTQQIKHENLEKEKLKHAEYLFIKAIWTLSRYS